MFNIPPSSLNSSDSATNKSSDVQKNNNSRSNPDSEISDLFKRSRDESTSSSPEEHQLFSARRVKRHTDDFKQRKIEFTQEEEIVGSDHQGTDKSEEDSKKSVFKRNRPIEEGIDNSKSQQLSGNPLEEEKNESSKAKKIQMTQAHENNHTFFEFDSNIIFISEGLIWVCLEEKVSMDQRNNDLLYLVKDTFTDREMELPLGLLRNLVSLMKMCSERTYTPLLIDHLTRDVKVLGEKDGAYGEYMMPVAVLWEASDYFRQFYSMLPKGGDDTTQEDLSFNLRDTSTLKLSLIEALFISDKTSLEGKEIPFLLELWQQANTLLAPHMASKVTQAMGLKIDSFPTEILNDDKMLVQLIEISKLARQTDCKELREKLDALIQRWFEEAAKGLPKHKQSLQARLSLITEKLAPVTLKTSLTSQEIQLISSIPHLDSLVCFNVDSKGLKQLGRFHSKINHLFIQSSTFARRGLGDVKALNNLRELNLSGCSTLRNEDLINLEGLERLEVLDLSGCVNITDECLGTLKGLNSLQKISLRGTGITTLVPLGSLPLKELDLRDFLGAPSEIIDFIQRKLFWTGTITFPNGHKYEGEWVGGERMGKGIYTWSNGCKYDGEWVKGKQTGKGIETLPDGRRYEGDWFAGKRRGKGIFTWPNGRKYEGDFVDDQRTGKGTFTVPGYKYVGDFINGKRSGKGFEALPDGRKYEGDWVDDKRNGKGIETWLDGHKYEGDWVNSKRNGKGIETWPDGRIFEGDFVEGLFKGYQAAV